ncbi:hypothetical protein HHK36_003184 [Tetracentron sinense]|uniref:BHLH domain-containing protein n=1 Tax=Tetracentron sinense TaxID=13715 RepID=A0A834ZQP8_TETSI|nr:hypothetical protein HHK36_003184 [Tetracentron sinense]
MHAPRSFSLFLACHHLKALFFSDLVALMEYTSTQWLFELVRTAHHQIFLCNLQEMEDPIFFPLCEMDSLDEFATQEVAATIGEGFLHSFSSESNSSFPTMNPGNISLTTFSSSPMEASQAMDESPTKQAKADNWNSCTTKHISTPEASSPAVLSYGNLNSLTNSQQFNGNLVGNINPEDDGVFGNLIDNMNLEEEGVSPGNMTLASDVLISQSPFVDQYHVAKAGQGTKRINTVTRSPSKSQDHIIAERKRREKLSERFIALSAIIPGLKKMDKTSVLEEAIKYLKQLQEQVKTLEEHTVKKTVESVVVVKKSQLMVDEEAYSSDENINGCSDEQLPDIEARVSDKNILLRIYCEKQTGVLVKTLDEIEKLHLTVLNSSVMPFGSSALDLTIIAQLFYSSCKKKKIQVQLMLTRFSMAFFYHCSGCYNKQKMNPKIMEDQYMVIGHIPYRVRNLREFSYWISDLIWIPCRGLILKKEAALMEISSARWLSELGIMDDPTFINECRMNSLDDQLITTQQMASALGKDFQDSFSSESCYSYQTAFTTKALSCSSMETSQTAMERPTKQIKTSTSQNSYSIDHISNPDYLFSYGNLDSPFNPQHVYGDIAGNAKSRDEVGTMNLHLDALTSHGSHVKQNEASVAGQVIRPPSKARDHIIAERKRREKLNQRFIALSAIVPGLKKMDKASVLGETISYLKQLQVQVKTLEEQTAKQTVESVVFIQKSQLLADDDTSSSNGNFDGYSKMPLPEIEARVSDKTVLIRIYCEKRKGVLVKALTEIEKLDLTVVNSSVIPFGSSAIDITIMAQMDVKFCMTVKDLVRNLGSAYGQFMRKEEDPSSVHL